MWKHGDIQRDLEWTLLVLIPKRKTDTQIIDLLELLRKVVEAIIEIRLRVNVLLHKVLHGFCAGRGTGTEILKPKLAMELDSLDQDPLFLVLIELQKAHNTVDCGRLQTNLEKYGNGPHMCRLLSVFWDQQEVATRQNEYHGPHLKQIGLLLRVNSSQPTF